MRLSSSKVELAIKCAAAFALPHSEVDTTRKDGSSEIEDGKDLHAIEERAIESGSIPSILEDTWPGFAWRAEVKFAYDLSTREGREIGQGSDRAYGELAPFEVPGTTDIIGRLGDRLVIVDRKSYNEVTPAARNPQLKSLAIAAASAYDAAHVEVAILHLIHGLDRARLDLFVDLDAFHDELVAVHGRVMQARQAIRQGLELDVNVGRQCRYCPAFDACPEQQKLIERVQSDSLALEVEQRVPIRSEIAGADLYELWKRVGMLHKRIGAALFARAKEGPIRLHSGKMFGTVTTTGNEKLDGDVVYDVVKDRHGQAIADTAVVRSATKTRLREALGFVGATSVAAAERAVLDEVRARGGAKRETKIAIEEFSPKLSAVAGGAQ